MKEIIKELKTNWTTVLFKLQLAYQWDHKTDD